MYNNAHFMFTKRLGELSIGTPRRFLPKVTEMAELLRLGSYSTSIPCLTIAERN